LNRDIGHSVGDPRQGAANRTGDVETVQGLLNVQMVKDRRSDRLTTVNGRFSPEVVEAVGEFQKRHSLAQTAVIKGGDLTIRALANFGGPRSMRVTGNLVTWLEAIEGFNATPYDDAHTPTKNATIGYGHKLHSGPVTESDREKWGPNGISRADAEGILRRDLSRAEDTVNGEVHVPLTQNQFDALASLTFNIGPDAFGGSTLLRLLNRGDYAGAAEQFLVWTRSGSTHPPGLTTRRREEKERFERH